MLSCPFLQILLLDSGLWPLTSTRHVWQGKYCSLDIFFLQNPFSLNSREGWHNPDRSAVPEIVTLSGANSRATFKVIKLLKKPFPPQFGCSDWTSAGRPDHFNTLPSAEMSFKKSNTKTGQFSKYIIFCWFLTRCHYTQPIFKSIWFPDMLLDATLTLWGLENHFKEVAQIDFDKRSVTP